MKKLKILIALTVTLSFLVTAIPSGAECAAYYTGQFIPYYENGEEVGVRCVYGGEICNCIGKVYYY